LAASRQVRCTPQGTAWTRWALHVLAFAVLPLAAPPAVGEECPALDSADQRPVYRLQVRADRDDLDWIATSGMDIAGRDMSEGWVEVVVDDHDRCRLIHRGLDLTTIERRAWPLPLGGKLPGEEPDRAPTSGIDDTAYLDPDELQTLLQQLALDHPDIVRVESLGTSLQGRTIWSVLVSDNAAVDEDELTVLFTATLHAREVMTTEVVVDMIQQLVAGYGTDPTITALVDAYQIWSVPMVNPDGSDIVFNVDSLWRKNAHDNDDNGRITWKDGVDVNRNYEWGWGGQCQGSSSTTSAATYRGPFEVSEPETAATIRLGRRILPTFYVEYHSYGEDVFYAMGCDPNRFSPLLSTVQGADKSISRSVGEQYAARIVQADGEPGFQPAPYGNRVDGIGRDHHAHESGAVAFVTELNSYDEGGVQPDYATWRQSTVEGQRPGWLWLIERLGGPAVGGHVFDAETGLPLAADLKLAEMTLPDGKRLVSRADTGRFHIIVVPGDYTLTVRAPGYLDGEQMLTVSQTWQPVEILLQPDGSIRLVGEGFEDPASAAAWLTLAQGDTATAGRWEWGEPLGTHAGTVQGLDLTFGNPRLDRTPAEGARAFVTGNTPGTALDEDDIDDGATTLTSPVWDLDGWYGVSVSLQHWLRTDVQDPLDGLAAEVSADGGESWQALGSWTASSRVGAASQAWAPLQMRLDDFVRPGPEIRLRFRATDDGPDNVVEAAIDDLEIRGFSLATQGDVADVRFSDAGGATIEWDPVPGAPDAVFAVVRGDLAQLAESAGAVDLGPLTCVGSGLPDPSVEIGGESPPPGQGWFYLARFTLGFSEGHWGRSSSGLERSGSGGCGP
jgi:hypothetical protein